MVAFEWLLLGRNFVISVDWAVWASCSGTRMLAELVHRPYFAVGLRKSQVNFMELGGRRTRPMFKDKRLSGCPHVCSCSAVSRIS